MHFGAQIFSQPFLATCTYRKVRHAHFGGHLG
jgi:hypothetical protein